MKNWITLFSGALLAGLAWSLPCAAAESLRLKDIGKLSGWRNNYLHGMGLVTGLAGTGDSPRSKITRQSMANLLSRFDMSVSTEDVQSRNVALVTLSASLPAFARPGDALNVTVTSAGDAASLAGGSLMMAALEGPDGRVYALAQGAVSVGGYQQSMNGNVAQKNHPTVGTIVGGATVEVAVPVDMLGDRGAVSYVLAEPDYTTATRAAEAINQALGQPLAAARDASGIDIAVPEGQRARLAEFLARIETVRVVPDMRARVVVNERTGTVVAGAEVRLEAASIAKDDLRVTIVTDNTISQPIQIGYGQGGGRTELLSNSRVSVDERGSAVMAPRHVTVADLMQSMARMKLGARDMISVLEALKAAGSLHAELIVQ